MAKTLPHGLPFAPVKVGVLIDIPPRGLSWSALGWVPFDGTLKSPEKNLYARHPQLAC